MKTVYIVGIILISLLQITCTSFGQLKVYDQAKFDRKPFRKNPYVIKQPKKVDRTAEYGGRYKPNPRVVEVDKKTGKYEFRWVGFDGKEKKVTYERPDAIEAIVAAKVERTQNGKFVYSYEISMLDTSPIYFRNFILQTFPTNSEVLKLEKELIMFGQMYPVGPFTEGIWQNWAYIGTDQDRIRAGDVVEFHLSSESPPGIVGCQAGGGKFGVVFEGGEELPSELENEIPVNQDLALGYTIGPDRRLSKFSDPDKIKYLLENLPKFQEAGWMSEGTAKNYRKILTKNDKKAVFAKAKKDFKNQHISSEVFHIIEGLSR